MLTCRRDNVHIGTTKGGHNSKSSLGFKKSCAYFGTCNLGNLINSIHAVSAFQFNQCNKDLFYFILFYSIHLNLRPRPSNVCAQRPLPLK